jgi:hypothetical protein
MRSAAHKAAHKELDEKWAEYEREKIGAGLVCP